MYGEYSRVKDSIIKGVEKILFCLLWFQAQRATKTYEWIFIAGYTFSGFAALFCILTAHYEFLKQYEKIKQIMIPLSIMHMSQLGVVFISCLFIFVDIGSEAFAYWVASIFLIIAGFLYTVSQDEIDLGEIVVNAWQKAQR